MAVSAVLPEQTTERDHIVGDSPKIFQ